MRANHNQDLTNGPIGKKLLIFALPLFGSSLIQQLYNTVDLMFVGRLLGKEASAAVGAGSLLITCMLGFFTGMSVGVGVAAAKAYGAEEKEKLQKVIHTSAGISLLGGIAMMAIGWILAPTFLSWLNTPDDIMNMAVVYMRIYFLSILPIVSYNISSGILRAVGNSRSPMMYQLFGGFANVIGNTIFIYILRLGVSGAALATLCSQGVAAILTIRHLCRGEESCRLYFSKIKIDPAVCGRILAIGLPAAVQSMVITLSNLIVQSQINSLGVDSIAAFTAYFKVESFIYLPILAIGQAVTTFCGQNVGAMKMDRVKEGTKDSIFMGVGITIVISGLILLFSKQAFGLFTNDADIVSLGKQLAWASFPFYFLYVFLEVLSGAIRGAGKALPPMVIIVVNMCVVRILILKLMMSLYHSAVGVARMYPLTWAMTVLCLAVYYKSGKWKTC